MKHTPIVLTFLIGCAVGFQIQKTYSRRQSASAPGLADQPLGIDSKQISQNEFMEYQQLKQSKSRLEKGEELQPNTTVAGNATGAVREGISIETSEGKIRIQSLQKIDAAQIGAIRSDQDIEKLLNDSQLESLASIFPSLTPIRRNDATFAQLLGRFSGETILTVEDRRALPTTMEFTQVGDKVRFDVHVVDSTMFKTDFTGTTNADGFFETLGEGGSSVFLSADSYSYRYFQLFYIPYSRALVGHFYKKWDKPGDYKAIGIVRLSKR